MMPSTLPAWMTAAQLNNCPSIASGTPTIATPLNICALFSTTFASASSAAFWSDWR
jgi:hypothetical protein